MRKDHTRFPENYNPSALPAIGDTIFCAEMANPINRVLRDKGLRGFFSSSYSCTFYGEIVGESKKSYEVKFLELLDINCKKDEISYHETYLENHIFTVPKKKCHTWGKDSIGRYPRCQWVTSEHYIEVQK